MDITASESAIRTDSTEDRKENGPRLVVVDHGKAHESALALDGIDAPVHDAGRILQKGLCLATTALLGVDGMFERIHVRLPVP